MKIARCLLLLIGFLSLPLMAIESGFPLLHQGKVASLHCASEAVNPLPAVMNLFLEDFKQVSGQDMPVLTKPLFKKNSPLIWVEVLSSPDALNRFSKEWKQDVSGLRDKRETFLIRSVLRGKQPVLLVLGSDGRGASYGLLEVSRLMGVSPLVWWADVLPEKKDDIRLPAPFELLDGPSVRYRGIFLNDEDWALMPWANQTVEPGSPKGTIGPKAYERIFQLLLRLRANTIWPAMHECSIPFFYVPGNREMAERYSIFIGTSHCEPLLCNIAGEWDAKEQGPYNYLTNDASIRKHWQKRLDETKQMNGIYTLGMRGEHDGKMQGAKTLDEQHFWLQKIIAAQRSMLDSTFSKPLEEIPQAFIPYKEVLDVYLKGLDVPEDVTLIWCDDNYGYISRLGGEHESARSGGGGVYYHASYWGRPHDYLWLASTPPALIGWEMERAWRQQSRDMWILNVGDIKPAEYLTEWFLDLAWNMEKPKAVSWLENPARHMLQFFTEQFGSLYAKDLTEIMTDYYHLAFQRKPEHMAWSRVEESDYPRGRTPVMDSDMSLDEMQARLGAYVQMERRTRQMEEKMPARLRDAFFQLVGYPVYGSSQLNQKLMYAQLSRQMAANGQLEEAKQHASASLAAFAEIERLTAYYNTEMAAGKWNRMMSANPRSLNVFSPPVLPEGLEQLEPKALHSTRVVLRKATSAHYVTIAAADFAKGQRVMPFLGHSGSVVHLRKGDSLQIQVATPFSGKVRLSVHTLPNHAVDNGDLRYEVRLNNGAPYVVNNRTYGRSEAWKMRVLRNQSVWSTEVALAKQGIQELIIKAIDDDIVLDQICLDTDWSRAVYLLPGTPVSVSEKISSMTSKDLISGKSTK